MNIVNEVIEEDKTIKDLKKYYPDKIKNLEETLLNYMGENDLKTLKTEFPGRWKYLNNKNWHAHNNFSIVLMIIKKLLTIFRKKTSSVNLKMIILMMKKQKKQRKLV